MCKQTACPARTLNGGTEKSPTVKPAHSSRSAGISKGPFLVTVHHPNHVSQDDHQLLVGKRPRLRGGGVPGSRFPCSSRRWRKLQCPLSRPISRAALARRCPSAIQTVRPCCQYTKLLPCPTKSQRPDRMSS